jgi:hypothetical protein
MPSIRFQEKEKPYFLPMRFSFIKSLRVLIKDKRSGPFLAREDEKVCLWILPEITKEDGWPAVGKSDKGKRCCKGNEYLGG